MPAPSPEAGTLHAGGSGGIITESSAEVALDAIREGDAEREVKKLGLGFWIAVGWLTEATGPDGHSFTRPGRGTFVLERREGRWLAVHSHFSLLPSQSETAHGRFPGGAAPA